MWYIWYCLLVGFIWELNLIFQLDHSQRQVTKFCAIFVIPYLKELRTNFMGLHFLQYTILKRNKTSLRANSYDNLLLIRCQLHSYLQAFSSFLTSHPNLSSRSIFVFLHLFRAAVIAVQSPDVFSVWSFGMMNTNWKLSSFSFQLWFIAFHLAQCYHFELKWP